MVRCWTKQTDKRGAGAVGDRFWESSLKHGSYGKLHRILRFTLGMSTLVTKCKKKKKKVTAVIQVSKRKLVKDLLLALMTVLWLFAHLHNLQVACVNYALLFTTHQSYSNNVVFLTQVLIYL